jgi:hypothetical protein
MFSRPDKSQTVMYIKVMGIRMNIVRSTDIHVNAAQAAITT